LTLYNISSFVSPTDSLYPAPAPRSTTFQVFLIFPNCQSYSTVQSYTPCAALNCLP